MKRIYTLTIGALIFCTGAFINLHGQNQLKITGNTKMGKTLTADFSRADIENIEWKVNGKTVAISGSERKGVTVAGGHCAGSNPNQLSNPNGLFVDKEDNLWVADTRNYRIQKFTPGNRNGVTIGADLPNAPSFPVNIFVRHNGDIYVADYFEAKVKLLKKGGTEWINVAGQNNELDLVRGVWVDKQGNVYCTQYGFFFNGIFELDGIILKYPPNSSAFEIVAGHNGIGPALNQFSAPASVMLDEEGDMYIADAANDHGLDNARAMKWEQGAKEGVVVAGGNGVGEQLNQSPGTGFAFIDKKDNVYVSNYYNARVMKWKEGAKKGKIVAGGNGDGDEADQLYAPFGIFVKGKYLYVADSGNERVQRFDLSEHPHHKDYNARHDGTYTATATFEDGSVEESNSVIISGNSAIPAPPSLIKNKSFAYPNPVTKSVTVNYTAETSSRYIFEITDISGRVLSRNEMSAVKGANSITIDVNRFAKGTYFINVKRPDKMNESIKLIKE